MKKAAISNLLPADYADWLASLKSRIIGARQRAVLSANAEQVRLYHSIGSEILMRQERQGWGAKVIDRLASDLRDAFPDMKGFSSSNLKYMRYFAQHCPDLQIGQQSADQLPWFHLVVLFTKVSDPAEREWYALRSVREAWPRDTLVVQIKNQLHLRQRAAGMLFHDDPEYIVAGAYVKIGYNPEIANAFFPVAYMESWGRGIELIRNACRSAKKPMPVFRWDNGLWVEFPFPEVNTPGQTLVKTPGQTLGKKPGKTPARILDLLHENPNFTVPEIAEQISKSESAVQRAILKLQSAGRLKRLGSRKSGYWEVVK